MNLFKNNNSDKFSINKDKRTLKEIEREMFVEFAVPRFAVVNYFLQCFFGVLLIPKFLNFWVKKVAHPSLIDGSLEENSQLDQLLKEKPELITFFKGAAKNLNIETMAYSMGLIKTVEKNHKFFSKYKGSLDFLYDVSASVVLEEEEEEKEGLVNVDRYQKEILPKYFNKGTVEECRTLFENSVVDIMDSLGEELKDFLSIKNTQKEKGKKRYEYFFAEIIHYFIIDFLNFYTFLFMHPEEVAKIKKRIIEDEKNGNLKIKKMTHNEVAHLLVDYNFGPNYLDMITERIKNGNQRSFKEILLYE